MSSSSWRTEDLTDPELLDAPDRQLLGMEQESWAMEQLASTNAQWVLVGQQVIMAEVRLGDNPINADQWDGYRAARARFYEMAGAVPNMIVLTGDIHSSWAFDLATDPQGEYDPETGEGSVGVEFVTPAVMSAVDTAGLLPARRAGNSVCSGAGFAWAVGAVAIRRRVLERRRSVRGAEDSGLFSQCGGVHREQPQVPQNVLKPSSNESGAGSANRSNPSRTSNGWVIASSRSCVGPRSPATAASSALSTMWLRGM